MNNDFANARAALKVWEADEPRRDKLLREADTDEDVIEWQNEENAAARKLQDAFHEDTKAYNSIDAVRHMHPRTIQKFLTTGRF